MNRFKFRVFDKLAKKYLVSYKNQGLLFGYGYYWQDISHFCNNENFAAEQYIGVKDGNDVEIYDGDIVSGVLVFFNMEKKSWEELETVNVHIWYYDTSWQGSENHPYSESGCELSRITKRTVIGNINISPELLSKYD